MQEWEIPRETDRTWPELPRICTPLGGRRASCAQNEMDASIDAKAESEKSLRQTYQDIRGFAWRARLPWRVSRHTE